MAKFSTGERLPYTRHSLDEQDVQAVLEVLNSSNITQGPMVEKFEQALCQWTGSAYAVAVNNGTTALHLACLAADLGPGDWLWTTANSFVASANCGYYCGAMVDLIDIELHNYNLDSEYLAKKLVRAADAGRLPKIIVGVDFAGHPCDWDVLDHLANEYNITMIDDAAHSLGAAYRGYRIGSGDLADMTTLSFHPAKAITTGEGGAILTSDDYLYDKLKRLRSHGITRDHSLMRGETNGDWECQQLDLGFNSRMSDIQAALGVSQLRHLDGFIDRRRYLADRYANALHPLPLKLPGETEDIESAWHLYVVLVDEEKTNIPRNDVYRFLQLQGIDASVHYKPIHLHPYFQDRGFTKGDYPVAEKYFRQTLTLPLFPAMTDEDQDIVMAAITEIFR